MPRPWRSRRTCLNRVVMCSSTRRAGIKNCWILVNRSLARTVCVMRSSNSGSKTGRPYWLVSTRVPRCLRRCRRQQRRFQEPYGSSAQPKRHSRHGKPNSFVRSMTGFDLMPRTRRIRISARPFATSIPAASEKPKVRMCRCAGGALTTRFCPSPCVAQHSTSPHGETRTGASRMMPPPRAAKVPYTHMPSKRGSTQIAALTSGSTPSGALQPM